MTPINNRHKKGFTIVELSLSVAFLGILMISVSAIVLGILSIYRKGLSLKAVNSTGRALIDEFSRTIASAPTKTAAISCDLIPDHSQKIRCAKDGAYLLSFQQAYGTVSIYGVDKKVPLHGAICTGRHSYIWNSGYTFNQSDPNIKNDGVVRASLSYKIDGTNKTLSNFRLIKVDDSNREVCLSRLDGYSLSPGSTYKLETELKFEPTELLLAADNDLALYDLTLFPPSQHALTGHTFFSGTFILATLRGGIDITSDGDYCAKATNKDDVDFDYCALSKFNFATRSIGELTGEEKEREYGQRSR